MTDMFKPMKAPTKALTNEQIKDLPWPMLASVKLDGIRGVVRHGVVWSNSGKPLRSKAVQAKFGKLEGMDGEIIYGAPNASNVYNLSTSFCNSTEIPEGMEYTNVYFYAFDDVRIPNVAYTERQPKVFDYDSGLIPLGSTLINTYEEFVEYETEAINAGFEGVMLRKPDGRYKEGRSTLKEALLLKIKRFQDDEAVILDYYEEMHNTNEATTDAQGYTERSTAKAGLVGKGTLGGFRVRNSKGQVFDVGGGYTAKDRQLLWCIRDECIGATIVYKHFPHGAKDAPRFPTFKGFRDTDDITDY